MGPDQRFGLVGLAQEVVADREEVHPGGEKTPDGIGRGADERFSPDIEARIHKQGTAGCPVEMAKQAVETRICPLVDRLDAGGAVDVGDGRDG
jgi:hypothetical protein